MEIHLNFFSTIFVQTNTPFMNEENLRTSSIQLIAYLLIIYLNLILESPKYLIFMTNYLCVIFYKLR